MYLITLLPRAWKVFCLISPFNRKDLLCLSLAAGVTTGVVNGQIGPAVSLVERTPFSRQGEVVNVGATPTVLSLAVDPGTTGGDQIDILLGDSAENISLILPNGNSINASTAAAAGVSWTFRTVTDSHLEDVIDTFSIPGRHVSIQLPLGASAGLYKIQADGSQLTRAAFVLVQYVSSSNINFGAAADSILSRLGDLVRLAAVLSDGSSPIASATVTAQVYWLPPVNGTVGNYQLVDQQTTSIGSIEYTYNSQLTNGSIASTMVEATLLSSDPNIGIEAGTVEFGDVGANQVASSLNSFSITVPAGYTLDLANLSWGIDSSGAPVSLTLSDSGVSPDGTAGEGMYIATFMPTNAGEYKVLLSATGQSASGTPFTRSAATSFTVSEPAARFAGVSDAGITGPNGLLQGVAVTATVTVQTPGSYQLGVTLTATNKQSVSATKVAALQAGTQQITATFSETALLALGVDGPYEKTGISLSFLVNGNTTLADYINVGGATQAYSLNLLDQGDLYFTGQTLVTTSNSNGCNELQPTDIRLSTATP